MTEARESLDFETIRFLAHELRLHGPYVRLRVRAHQAFAELERESILLCRSSSPLIDVRSLRGATTWSWLRHRPDHDHRLRTRTPSGGRTCNLKGAAHVYQFGDNCALRRSTKRP
jgi:hypothetical protein